MLTEEGSSEPCGRLGETPGAVSQLRDCMTREAQYEAIRRSRLQAGFGQQPGLHLRGVPDPGGGTWRRVRLQAGDKVQALVRNHNPQCAAGMHG